MPKRPADPSRASGQFLVVGIGASAGGLEACRKLFAAMPSKTGMAFIVVQHLDPDHPSMMVDLLAGHTPMAVRQAGDEMPIAPETIYVIPPGTYLSVKQGMLHLSEPQARHGTRMPFDYLLPTLAEAFGARAACIVLSGTGGDGSTGALAVRERGGLIIAQLPEEASYDGMPRAAIASGAVDRVLPLADMPAALLAHASRLAALPEAVTTVRRRTTPTRLPEIIALLRATTGHDFTPYKSGTLLRRIERRMALAVPLPADIDGYIVQLRDNSAEQDQLAKDLLIHVTSFFRDARVFEMLAKTVIPDLVRRQAVDEPLRVWVCGCSTGEEAYSLAMLFHEAIAADGRPIRLQIFASDIDPDAVAAARDGFYAQAIEHDITPARLARFFLKERDGYQVSSDLRAAVVFTVQDVLTDPPFSRIDMVSCRNMLIYLLPDAQAKVIALFHFALRPGGILLLGNAETINLEDGRFEELSKSERLYRHVGRVRPGELGLVLAEAARVPVRPGLSQPRSRQTLLADFCQRLVVQTYAPAAVLVNRRYECLYSVGPIDRYLRVAPGDPTSDLLAMARHHMQAKLRGALHQASLAGNRVIVPGGHMTTEGGEVAFNIAVQPVQHDGENLMLVSFIDEQKASKKAEHAATPQDSARVSELEQELEATRTELQGAIRNLELSAEEQRAINEEALSVNEEFQSTNEELLTSKEELQSLNEELTALNTQLQETLERQRTAANDLQNVLYSTDVATIFLDQRLNIRLFTPTTRALFNVIPSDVGRPLSDLHSLAFDATLLADASTVLRKAELIEREIETHTGKWFIRRIMPYRTADGGIGGVVITFVDQTERKRIADALMLAKGQAEMANVAKTRFLAAASHDLRQPLQTLSLLQGFLAKSAEGPRTATLVARLGDTLGAMSGMLNTLLDLNQIEAGTVRPAPAEFPIEDLLMRLRDEFTYLAHAQGLELRVVPCSLMVHSDPRLLEQMIRNLLSNAVKYTKNGKILLGCRRHRDMVSIEVWDSGIGIPAKELDAIFEEYHQLDNTARERSRGLGLGLSIVRHLAGLLGHRVRVRSKVDSGSVFCIEVQVPPQAPLLALAPPAPAATADDPPAHAGSILVVEDDPELRELLEMLLTEEGHLAAAAADGGIAVDLVTSGKVRPDLVLADYNLPNGMNGLQVAARLRQLLGRQVPVIILTGDTATDTLRAIAAEECVHMHKPVRMRDLVDTMNRLLPSAARGAAARDVSPPMPAAPIPASPTLVSAAPPAPAHLTAVPGETVYVVDDDRMVREQIRALLELEGVAVQDFVSAESFLAAYRRGAPGCLLLDVYLPGKSGLELVHQLRQSGHALPVVMVTGKGDVLMAVQSMKAGALDFIEKPVAPQQLLNAVERALAEGREAGRLLAWREDAAHHVAGLTARQREIMTMVLAGHPSKNIAADLGISQRTVENHRAAIMKRTATRSLPALARLALAASGNAGAVPQGIAAPPTNSHDEPD